MQGEAAYPHKETHEKIEQERPELQENKDTHTKKMLKEL